MQTRFIKPAQPMLRPRPPTSSAWLHEVKFDGWRIQLHKHGRDVVLYTRNGHDYTRRLPTMAKQIAALPGIRSTIIDGELVASDASGASDFHALQLRTTHERDLCIWAFDLLYLNGRDLRPRPLTERKKLLEKLIKRAHANCLRYSESFDDGVKLLDAAERMHLEGIVSKRRDGPYRSEKNANWIKVKSATWRAANRERWQMFRKAR